MSVAPLWQEFSFVTGFLVFAAYVAVDGMYAYYTHAISEKQAVRAATIGSLMHFLIALGVVSYVQNYLYVIPLALGSWIGTYAVVRRFK